MQFSLKEFSANSVLNKLILVNVGVFVLLKLLYTFLFLFSIHPALYQDILDLISIPSDVNKLLFRPWTILTYMFVHVGFLHLLFNMLWLYWLGQIFMEYLGEKKLLAVYLLGGISGAIVFVVAYNIFPAFGTVIASAVAIGASAGILAIVVATATLLPDYKIQLMFIGPVALKWIAVFSIVLDVLSLSEGNAGGHFAHLGGALFGFIFIRQLQKGNDLSKGLSVLLAKLTAYFTFKSKMKVAYRNHRNENPSVLTKTQKENAMNEILDKIAKSGYDSLSKEEKEILFKASKEN